MSALFSLMNSPSTQQVFIEQLIEGLILSELS